MDPTSHFIGREIKACKGEGTCKAVTSLGLQARWPPPRCQAATLALHAPTSLTCTTFGAGLASDSRPFPFHLLRSFRRARTPPGGSRKGWAGPRGPHFLHCVIFPWHPLPGPGATYSYLSTKGMLLLSDWFIFIIRDCVSGYDSISVPPARKLRAEV